MKIIGIGQGFYIGGSGGGGGPCPHAPVVLKYSIDLNFIVNSFFFKSNKLNAKNYI